MSAWLIGGLLVVALAAMFVFHERFQRCPSCSKFALSSAGHAKISCINKTTGQYYPEARLYYTCRACGTKHAKDFRGKWLSGQDNPE